MDLCNRNDIQALLLRHGFRFSKGMGQNFLIESWVPRDTADACGADEHTGVLEIGPGIGPLTAELCRRAGKVVSVELDHRLYPVLAETMSGFDNFTLVPGDIMKQDLSALVAEHFAGLRPILCANLPYNITPPADQLRKGWVLCVHNRTHPEGGSPAHLRPARNGGLWRLFPADAVLHGAGAALHRAEHLLSAHAQGDLGGDPLHDPGKAPGHGAIRSTALANGEGRVRPAAQDIGELPANGLYPPQARPGTDHNGLRPPCGHTG